MLIPVREQQPKGAKKMKKLRFGKTKLVAAAAAAATVGVLASSSPASATQWTISGGDMRGFVIGSNPQFACNGYGSTAVSPLYIRSASNTGLYVYETVYWQYWDGYGWVNWSPTSGHDAS